MSLSEKDCGKIKTIVANEVRPIHQALFGTEEDREAGIVTMVRKHEEVIPQIKLTNKILTYVGGVIALTLVSILFKILFHF